VNLSPHFTLDEMLVTTHREIDNSHPPAEVVEALKRTARGLETVRARLGGMPIIITSGWRCPELNAAVGGQKTSQHLIGEAVDFLCPRFGRPLDIAYAIRDTAEIDFDQVIAEFTSRDNGGWVHISFSRHPRRQAFRIERAGAMPLH